MRQVTHWIGGRSYEPLEPITQPDGRDAAPAAADDHAGGPTDAARTGDLYEPATGRRSGSVDFASAAVVDEAVGGELVAAGEPVGGGAEHRRHTVGDGMQSGVIEVRHQ